MSSTLLPAISDPAVEAAHRALAEYGPKTHCEVAAAREALKPVQEWYGRILTTYEDSDDHESQVVRSMLAELAPLIYASGDIER